MGGELLRFLRFIIAVFAICCLPVISGCGFIYEPEEESRREPPSSHIQSAPGPALPTPITPTAKPKAKNINLLTGMPNLSEEAIGKRPVAVMINNISDALPQYGIGEADLIFELPVEHGVTRLMAMYGDYTKVPRVCSVRSCRYYFPILAAGYDAYYVHWGQDETIATQVLDYMEIDTIDGMIDTYGLFYRDEERQQKGFSYEHTGAFDGPSLPEALRENSLRMELPVNKNHPFFDFSKNVRKPGEKSCNDFTVSFSSDYFSDFAYKEKTNLYYKGHSGDDHRDGRTGQQLAFTNVFVLETAISERDSVGRLDLDWQGGGEAAGYYISQGGIEPITWEKEDEYSNLIFYNSAGARLQVNPGRSYICFISPGGADFQK